MSGTKWNLKPLEDDRLVASLSARLNDLPEPLARILALRGIRTLDSARSFFRATTEDLHDPYRMADMDTAAERVCRALQEGERIQVYGDYDVDGTTATALMTSFLRSAGGDVRFFIPDRFKHGYGLCTAGIDAAHNDGVSLIIALDCGITAHKEAEYAAKQGIDLVICDHHTPLETLPEAAAVLNPKRSDCDYPFKDLCGCGVAFKLAQAVHTRLDRDPEDLFSYLDLVAVATAGDVVSVQGENRIMLREGLHRLRTQPRIGFQALADGIGGGRGSSLKLSEATATSVIFTVGPRINAAGRMGDAERAVHLLLAEDELEAVARARQLERLNEERRALDREMQEDAFRRADRLAAGGMRHSFVLHNPDWHLGVIGIVASRVVERYLRPSLLLTTVDPDATVPLAKGSARSTAGVNVYEAIRACEDLLTEFGGHDQAAGFTLPVENIPAFAEQFEAAVAGMIRPEALVPQVEVDALLGLDQLDRRFWAVDLPALGLGGGEMQDRERLQVYADKTDAGSNKLSLIRDRPSNTLGLSL